MTAGPDGVHSRRPAPQSALRSASVSAQPSRRDAARAAASVHSAKPRSPRDRPGDPPWALGCTALSVRLAAPRRPVLDRLPDPVHPDHHFVVDPAKANSYAVDVYRWLGADAAARAVLEHSRGPDGAIQAPMRRSEALLTLGTVAARRGEPDVAVGHGLAALGDPRQCKPSLLLVAADLDAELSAHRDEAVIKPWRATLTEVHQPQAPGN